MAAHLIGAAAAVAGRKLVRVAGPGIDSTKLVILYFTNGSH
jgi:hypothetical protein